MKKLIKSLLIFSGICFIAFPFVVSRLDLLPLPEPINQITKKLNNQKTPYTPSFYAAKAEKLITDATKDLDPKKAASTVRRALETVNEGLIFYPNSENLYATRGEIYMLLDGTVDDALLFAFHDFKKAYEFSPKEISYGQKAVSIALQLESFDQAADLLYNIHQTEPDNAEILLDLAQAQTKAGDIESAIASYTTLIKLLPAKESAEVRLERDALARLIAATMQNASESAYHRQENPIGGTVLSTVSPPDTIQFPDELTITDSKINNPYQTNTKTAALSGESILTKGRSSITVENTNVTPETAVYLAPTAENTNQVLYVSTKQEGKFTVSTDEEAETDILFKWWIVKK